MTVGARAMFMGLRMVQLGFRASFMLCLHISKFLIVLEHGLHFHFPPRPTNYVATPRCPVLP